MSECDEQAAGAGGAQRLELRPGVYKRLFKNRSFRSLWMSGFVSGVGDWLVIGLLMPLVTQLSGGSSFAVAGILIAKIIPALVFSSFIGVFVDRFDKRHTMIGADLFRAVLVLALAFTNNLWIIYFIVLLTEVAALFFIPSKNALIPLIVDDDDIASANGLNYTTQQASMIVGLAASGAIVALFERVVRGVVAADLPVAGGFVGWLAPELLGPRAGVFVDSMTFVLSATFIILMPAVKSATGSGKMDLSLLGRDVKESWVFLREHKELRGFLTTIGLAILGGGAIVSVGLIHVQQNLTGSIPFLEEVPVLERLIATPQIFFMVFLAVGMVAGALVVPRLAERLTLQALFVGGVAGFGLSMLGFASFGIYSVASLFAVGAGFCLAAVTVAGNTYVQETVCEELRGRVFTALESVIRVALLLSLILTAPLGDFIGGIVKDVVEARGILPDDVVLTGSRITLTIASFIVLGAAYYGFRTLDWKTPEEPEQPEKPATDAESPGDAPGEVA